MIKQWLLKQEGLFLTRHGKTRRRIAGLGFAVRSPSGDSIAEANLPRRYDRFVRCLTYTSVLATWYIRLEIGSLMGRLPNRLPFLLKMRLHLGTDVSCSQHRSLSVSKRAAWYDNSSPVASTSIADGNFFRCSLLPTN
jgi:hypothetical protein